MSLHGIKELDYTEAFLCGQYLVHLCNCSLSVKRMSYLLFESTNFYVSIHVSSIIMYIFDLLDLTVSEVYVLNSPIRIGDLSIFLHRATGYCSEYTVLGM